MAAATSTWSMLHTVFDSTSETFSMLHTVLAKASWAMIHSINGIRPRRKDFAMSHTVIGSGRKRFDMNHSVVEVRAHDEIETFDMLHSITGIDMTTWMMYHTITDPIAFMMEMRHSIA